MRFTMPSRILANLLLPEIEEHLDRGISAFSSLVLMHPCDPATETLLVMTISSVTGESPWFSLPGSARRNRQETSRIHSPF